MTRTLALALLLWLTTSLAWADPPASQSSDERDPVWQGALIGGAAGVGAALIFTRANCGPFGSDRECEVIAGPIGFAIFVPAGIVTGVLIDRAIGNQRITVVPVVGTRGAALSVTLRPRG